MERNGRLERARSQVERMTGFYIHLTVFVLVMLLMLVINAWTGGGWWVQWPLIGWGIGILVHAFAVFGRAPNFVREWQLRKIRELRDKM